MQRFENADYTNWYELHELKKYEKNNTPDSFVYRIIHRMPADGNSPVAVV
jgi:hypothetical protein